MALSAHLVFLPWLFPQQRGLIGVQWETTEGQIMNTAEDATEHIFWITRYPQWYQSERRQMELRYPDFRVDEARLRSGYLTYYGELTVRSSGGTVRYPVAMYYPDATPYEAPVVMPLQALPQQVGESSGPIQVEPQFFDYRHQMRNGALCLFQRETRTSGGDVISGINALRRAERWLLGMHTGHWPPDSADSELETHFNLATSVLLGAAFYDDSLTEGTSGEFYLVPDYRRAFECSLRQVFPYIATALTANIHGIIRVIDARNDLERLYPWIRAEAWDPNATAQSTGLTVAQQSHGIERGGWWYLPQEPRPFRDGAGFLRALATGIFGQLEESEGITAAWNEVCAKLRGNITAEANNFLAFCYPGRQGGLNWLMILIPRDSNVRKEGDGVVISSNATKREAFCHAPVFLLNAQSIRPSELGLRNRSVVEPSIATKTVALIGLGALGSKVAELLAQAGVLSFRLCDLDMVTTGNAVRHIAGVSSFGTAKVTAVMRRLLDINPHIEFEEGAIWNGSATSSRQDLVKFILPADIVIATTADEAVEAFINETALVVNKPVIYGRALRHGSMGRIFIVRPGTGDACKACLAQYARYSHLGEPTPPDWINVTETEDAPVLHECGRPVIPASAIDLSFVAGIVARTALEFLENAPESIGSSIRPANHWLWTRKGANDIDARLQSPLSTFMGYVSSDPNCTLCQAGSIKELLLSEDTYATIVNLTEASPDRETGGILIGYIDPTDGRAIALRATDPGPKATQTATRFVRDVVFTQAELDRANLELGEQGQYIGEWHSHLVAAPNPSVIDVESLFGIAESDNYATQCPVMVIAGFDPASSKVSHIRAWSFPLNSGMKRIELRHGNSAEKYRQ